MPESAFDRDLLFGVIALQMEFVTRDALIAAIKDWAAEGQKSLDQILVERGALAVDERALLEPLVGKHLQNQVDDAERSRAALSSISWIKEGSARPDDHDLTAVRPASRAHSPGAPSIVASRFDIVRPHARGGLGEVFVARDRELGREVALKQIQPQFADDVLSRARFVREAEITGGLEHPGVVPVYGLGWDVHGRPYYAMRFIRGDSLKTAIDRFHAVDGPAPTPGEWSLELRKLLRRFLDVCNAIDYAHSRGVLHRDIKPSNIVVGMHGETLVVDWGLAKTVGRTETCVEPDERPLVPSTADESVETLPGLALGTPSFMSPEQAAGALDRIGPTCDVYSLGATLYCLLTGRPPFQGSSVDDVLQKVRQGTFPPPRQVVPSIPQALEAICLKSMALEARDRYPSAQALAEDIERWMAGEPVLARREPMAERIVRGMRRRRTTVTAAAAATLVALVGSAVVLAVQARANHDLAVANDRERARFDLAMESIRTFRTSVSDDLLLREPQFHGLRARLLHGARQFSLELESLLEGQTDRRSRLALCQAYDELAALTDKIGSKPEALDLYRHELTLWRELARGTTAGALADAPAEVARCLLVLGSLHYQTGHPDDAIAAYEEARNLLEGLDRPAVATRRRSELATCYHLIGDLLAATGRPREAMNWYQKGRSLREAMIQDHPSDTQLRSDLAELDNAIGILHWSSGQPAPAVESFAKARAAFEAMARDHPTDTEFRRRLATGYNAMGYPLHAIGKTAQALKAFEAARDILEALVQDNSAHTEFRRQLADSHSQIGTLLWDTGRPAEALAPYERARALLEALVQANPAVAEIRNHLARCYSQLGHVLLAIGQPAEALAWCEKARALREALVLANPSLTAYRSDLAVTLGIIGTVKRALGQFTDAVPAFRRAIELLDGLRAPSSEDYYNLACYHAQLAGLAGASGSGIPPEGARTEADRAMQHLHQAASSGFRMLSLMAIDRDLDALRSRPDFQLLIMDVTFPEVPFAR